MADLDKFLDEFQAMEKDLPKPEQVITARLLACHNTQRKHFLHCITPPENAKHEIIDRFHRRVLRRGSGKNENQWKLKKSVFPQM
eukprot:CAMPEP_0172433712 /NCGR_PEP_ID=MMETSP1064-20121228/69340_1 /TAXON_ID=202472 /ORGANISM="Aulacoseira subarctica , Strain CCAP 1002/5" /LENGTH=84 /DNA_ID=CAMNT_0013181789 /DNA_START=184 /DNA_END=435 /DNA_ORIENTATION=+